jgi:hypothetical protein
LKKETCLKKNCQELRQKRFGTHHRLVVELVTLVQSLERLQILAENGDIWLHKGLAKRLKREKKMVKKNCHHKQA